MERNSSRMACCRAGGLLGKSIDRLAHGFLLVRRKLVQAIVQIAERLLLLRRKLVESLKLLLQFLPLPRGQTI